MIAGNGFTLSLGVEAPEGGWKRANGSLNHVDPSFFRTLGVPLRAGRDFTDADKAGSPRVAILNERFARESGLGVDALGKHLRYGDRPDETPEIVGIVAEQRSRRVRSATRSSASMRRARCIAFALTSRKTEAGSDAARQEGQAAGVRLELLTCGADGSQRVNHQCSL